MNVSNHKLDFFQASGYTLTNCTLRLIKSMKNCEYNVKTSFKQYSEIDMFNFN